MVILREGWQKFLEAWYISGTSLLHGFLNMNISREFCFLKSSQKAEWALR